MNRIVQYFVRGLALFVPLVLTLWLLWKAFRIIDDLLPLHTTPGAGFVVVLSAVLFTGWLATHVVFTRLFQMFEQTLERLPLVSLLYGTLRDVTQAVLGEKRAFDQPVWLRISPDSPVLVLGFLTREHLESLGKPGMVAVYVPQSYAFAGLTFVVPSELVERAQIPAAYAMSFAVSAGMAGGRGKGP